MDNVSLLESKIQQSIGEINKLREEKKTLLIENKKLEAQCALLSDENTQARKILTHNTLLVTKQKRVKERIERLWEIIARAI